ncbi:hypothetical protein ATCC90586_011685 [Pythium insidiosum]|nr:hypothetical protein ATCC90586_011685 [Pythium insidiosum]
MGLAEMLTLASIIVIILNIVEISFPAADLQAITYVDKVIEKVSLWFVAVFRFYFLAMFRGGWRGVWSFHRDELFFYLLLVMHEIPFIVLEHYFPTLHFEYVQGAYNRLTIVLCLWPSVKARQSNGRWRSTIKTTKAMVASAADGPSPSSVGDASAVTLRHPSVTGVIVPT